MEIVYGPGNVPGLPPPGKLPPFLDKTLEHLFADVWMRPGLSLRDRRLVVLGATAALGRGDLIEIQTKGALHNQELTPAELQEAVLQLAYYVGWGNATSAFMGVSAAIQKAAAKPAAP
jgi:4-carboxymuconolactone decarboxylase